MCDSNMEAALSGEYFSNGQRLTRPERRPPLWGRGGGGDTVEDHVPSKELGLELRPVGL